MTMTFKPGDKVRRKLRNIYVTVASMFEDGTAFVDDSGITQIAENWEPLPAKPEDVRLKLFGIVHEWLDGRCPGCTGFTATDLADAILAKFPNLKTPEGT